MGISTKRILYALPALNIRGAERLLLVLPSVDYPINEISAAFDANSVTFFSPFCDVVQALSAQGLDGCHSFEDMNGAYDAAVMVLPRAKDFAQDTLSRVFELVPSGQVVIDGHKTDGIEAMLRDLQRHDFAPQAVSKDHGKVILTQSKPLPEWKQPDFHTLEGGFVTRPGIFSADAPDPGSVFLSEHLPANLGKEVLDLGAGWGYLSRGVLQKNANTRITTVEIDARALAAARKNLCTFDERVTFMWEDATRWRAQKTHFDTVIMNPPFHQGRKADVQLGQRFIVIASQHLGPSGELWMVANRHLPYERVLEERFRQVSLVSQSSGYKIYRAKGARKGK